MNVVVGVVTSLLALAALSVVVSQRANTQNVIGATGTALSGVIKAAVSPITGNSSNTFGNVGQTIQGLTGL